MILVTALAGTATAATPARLVPARTMPQPLLSDAPPPMLKHAPAPMLRGAPRPFGRAVLGMSGFYGCSGRTPLLVDRSRYDAMIREIATRHGLEYALVKAVIKAESDFDPLAVSRAGAQGLMQLMPATAAEHGVCHVFHPRDNVEGGCRHLRGLLDRYAGNVTLAVAAYNAGVQRVAAAKGVPAIAETQEYLGRVLRYRLAYQRETPAL